MSIVNGVITDQSPLGGELFTFFGVGTDANGRYNWGALPNSTIINIKSKHKPVEFLDDNDVYVDSVGRVFSRRTRLSDAQRLKVNYGHTFVQYTDALNAIRGVAEGTNFPYNRPTAWFRPADFWGYNHYADNWHTLTTTITKISQGGVTQLELTDIENIFNFGRLSGLNANNVNFGFLMASAFSSTQAQVYFFSMTDMRYAEQQLSTLLGDGKLSFNTTNIPVGTWKMYPVITTAVFAKDSFNYIREETENGYWYPYPFSNTHTITIVESGSSEGEDVVIDSIYIEDGGYDIRLIDSLNLIFQMFNVILNITNEGSAAYNVSIEAHISNVVEGTEVNKPQLSMVVSVPANTTVTQVLYNVKEENSDEAYRFAVGDTPPVLYIRYFLTKEGQVQESSTTIELDKY